jgi:nucleoside-diphosphate-sugar epimerase
MIAVVTGTSGFIGSRLVDALVWRGWTVRRLVRAGTPAGDDRAAITPAPARPSTTRRARRTTGEIVIPEPLGTLETYTVDYRDPRTFVDTPALDGADVVFHVGGVTKARSEAAFRAGNVGSTRTLLDAIAARATRPRRFVLVSSQAAAGPASSLEHPISEDDTPQPFEAYGRSKLEAEQLVREHPANIPWTIVRPAAVYGPGDVDFRAVFQQVARGIGIYPVPREARLSIVYVDDLVDALVRAGTTPSAMGRTFFVSAEDTSWRDIYRAAAAAAHQPLRFELDLPDWLVTAAGHVGDVVWGLTGHAMLVNANKVALGRPMWWLCDGTRARAELGVTPRVSLTDGARRTFDWYRERGWL